MNGRSALSRIHFRWVYIGDIIRKRPKIQMKKLLQFRAIVTHSGIQPWELEIKIKREENEKLRGARASV